MSPTLEQAVPTAEPRLAVLNRLRHLRWCTWSSDRVCVCKAGRVLMDLIAAEREDERRTTPPDASRPVTAPPEPSHMDVRTENGQELLDYLDNLADLAGDGERALAFTTAWRAVRARLPFIEREAAAATPSPDPLDVLRGNVIESARHVHDSQQTSGSTLPPGVRGVGGQMMTGWIRAEPFEDLLEATYALMREEQRIAEAARLSGRTPETQP